MGALLPWIAALLVAFHPFLIALSTTGYAEILAAALEFGAIYWSIRLIEDHGRWCWLFAGVCWGLSYLNRTECLILPLFTVGVFLLHALWQKWPLRRWLTRSAAFITVFALFVAPYVMLFYHYTGKVRFEGKNLLNYTIGQRKLDGKPQPLASRELTPDLRELGPSLDTGAYTTYSPYPTGFRDLARYYARAARNNPHGCGMNSCTPIISVERRSPPWPSWGWLAGTGTKRGSSASCISEGSFFTSSSCFWQLICSGAGICSLSCRSCSCGPRSESYNHVDWIRRAPRNSRPIANRYQNGCSVCIGLCSVHLLHCQEDNSHDGRIHQRLGSESSSERSWPLAQKRRSGNQDNV